MNRKFTFLLCAWMGMASLQVDAQTAAARFNMSLSNGKITESVTGNQYQVESQLVAFNVEGVDGDALRFDGYSNYVKAALPSSLGTETLTFSVLLAAETYPMMQVDVAETTPTYATICGNLDESGKKGIALELSSQGDLRVRYGSASGYLLSLSGTKKLERGKWQRITAVFDMANNAATLYLGKESIGTGRMSRKALVHSTNDFYIGKNATSSTAYGMNINTFCGLIDDISIYNSLVDVNTLSLSDATPDFAYPASRYEGNLWRPQFHGMPSGSWTNESHGMTYANGRYHLFFQKNANGPYMSRLHWGHISSENLYQWEEEPIAVYPGESYDIKGCWSGCVYEENGTPYILYTAVDNAKATIAKVKPTATTGDDALKTWEKEGIIINGCPAGMSADFRDPYYFTANGKQYIIVGTSKNNVGACTLHRYENGSWTNDGTLFFQGTNANQHGTFWEMPTITDMGDGSWLFTCTPLGTGSGVRTLCWVGTIGNDGKFTSNGSGVQYLEMGGISKDGYGLLSPTIYQHDGKTLLLGIVPDKLATEENKKMGWAHNYSLPREISLDTNGNLVQKPYEGLKAMRSDVNAQYTLSAEPFTQSLSPVSGRQIELLGTYTVASGTMGFRFLKSGSKQASLTYDADLGTLKLDLTQLDRTSNDQGVYSGVYSATLPEKPSIGSTLTLHVFLDGSIADIFVNDRWAFSVRLFPTNAEQVEVEAFSTASAAATISAWTLDATATSGIAQVSRDLSTSDNNIYNLQGYRLNAAPQRGIYIQNGRKIVVK